MSTKIQLKRGTTAAWNSSSMDTTLYPGQIGVEYKAYDNYARLKIGDYQNQGQPVEWDQLKYLSPDAEIYRDDQIIFSSDISTAFIGFGHENAKYSGIILDYNRDSIYGETDTTNLGIPEKPFQHIYTKRLSLSLTPDGNTPTDAVNVEYVGPRIISSGHMTSWDWRIWSDGFAEAFGRIDCFNVYTVNAWGNLYESDKGYSMTYPIVFKTPPRQILSISGSEGNNFMLEYPGGDTSNTINNTGTFYFVRPVTMQGDIGKYVHVDIQLYGQMPDAILVAQPFDGSRLNNYGTGYDFLYNGNYVITYWDSDLGNIIQNEIFNDINIVSTPWIQDLPGGYTQGIKKQMGTNYFAITYDTNKGLQAGYYTESGGTVTYVGSPNGRLSIYKLP